MSINDGGPAFPFGQVSELTGQPINGFFNPGMTLRDHFAGLAMAALLANPNSYTVDGIAKQLGIDPYDYDRAIHWPMVVAMDAVSHADALIARLARAAKVVVP
jgi:hypothetical protein